MRKLLSLSAALLAVATICSAQPSQELGKVRIVGNALNLSNTATGANQTIQIDIKKWSPAGTRDTLIQAFLDGQQDGLLTALRKLPEIGRWRFPGYMGPDPDNIYRLGTPIRYAANQPLDEGGRRIVIMTDRLIPFKEEVNRPRSYDYPFTLMEMHFDREGNGEGRMASHTQVRMDKKKGVIEIENYSSEPVHLRLLKLEPQK